MWDCFCYQWGSSWSSLLSSSPSPFSSKVTLFCHLEVAQTAWHNTSGTQAGSERQSQLSSACTSGIRGQLASPTSTARAGQGQGAEPPQSGGRIDPGCLQMFLLPLALVCMAPSAFTISLPHKHQCSAPVYALLVSLLSSVIFKHVLKAEFEYKSCAEWVCKCKKEMLWGYNWFCTSSLQFPRVAGS